MPQTEEKISTPQVEPPVITEPELVKIEAPEIEGPKTVGKIDLSQIDSSTRPKKVSAKKQDEEAEEINNVIEEETEVSGEAIEQELPVVESIDEEAVEEEIEEEDEEQEDEEQGPSIENIRAEKLEGPKIVGKIQLPADSNTRPKPGLRDEKRKRKRIPVDKKGDNKPSEDNRDRFKKDFGKKPVTTGQEAPKERRNITIQKAGVRPPQHHDDRRGRDGRRGRQHRHEEKEIDQKEIQEKIRETQAKLSGSTGRGKSLKAKHRREKRHEMAEAGELADTNKLQVTEFVTVSELANLLDVSFAEVISKCMSLGIMVSINQRLDAEVIELVAGEFGYEVEFIGLEDTEEDEEEIEENE
jgi:translation initiation factor IF-2